MASIEEMIGPAQTAQREWEKADQKRVDRAVRAMARAVFDNAEELARIAVAETRMGVYEDKVKKNKNKARILWSSLKDKKTVGIIDRDLESGIVKIAKPMGVVGSVTPCTNPIVTPMCNGMFAIKGRNAVIFAPHPRAVKSMAAFVAVVRAAWAELNLPENLIQFISDPSVETTISLMKQVNIVVATGGMGMVKSAYSSGKPAYGVGAGNVQCILDRGINIDEAVEKIIEGRRFDNGIICSGEQAVMVPRDQAEGVAQSFTRQGGFCITDNQTRQRLLDTVFVGGVMNRECVGISAVEVARKAGIAVPAETKVLIIHADGAEEKSLVRKEKMCPVMALFTYETFQEAVEIARINLEIEGKGHSVSIHSSNLGHIEELGLALPVSRVVVNQVCSTSSGGSFYNGFAPTTTLGCGTWGNNIISENLDYKHLINITRIGLSPQKVHVPTDEELWS
jgi:succinate-semialdehyde dehydrogenase